VTFLNAFSAIERAVAITAVAPFVLMGCGIHQTAPAAASQGQLPAPTYREFMPVPDAPPRPRAPGALAAAIENLRDHFDGLAGIAVRSVEGGWSVESVDADRPMPQQSVSKLWVAMTVLDAIDKGRLTLDTPVVVRKQDLTLFHQPLAVLVKGDGYHTDVRDLLKRALTMSDNTANDRLLNLVGGPTAVRGFIARNALGEIRFGPGERLLQSGTAGLTWQPSYSFGRGFEQARARLPREARVAAYQRYVAHPPDGAAPAAIAGALAKLKRGALLSPQSTAYLISTMESSRTGKYRLRGAVPPGWTFGHKTGTGQDLLGRTAGYNDVGLLTAPDGRSYAIAVMIGDSARSIQEKQLFMQGVVKAVVANHRG